MKEFFFSFVEFPCWKKEGEVQVQGLLVSSLVIIMCIKSAHQDNSSKC